MKQSLYNITEDQRYNLQEIEAMEGELTPELEEAMAITAMQLEHKSLNYLTIIKSREAFNIQIDEEVKRLQGMKKRNVNLVGRLKENLLSAVKTFGEYNAGLNSFGTRKSSTVEVLDVNSLPVEYKTVKVTEAANKTAIKAALKSGIEIEGCSIKENLNLKIN